VVGEEGVEELPEGIPSPSLRSGSEFGGLGFSAHLAQNNLKPQERVFDCLWTILKLARTIFAPRFARGGGEAQKI
jgi:hypothetical protein